MDMNRRNFIRFSAEGLATSSVGALGFGAAGEALAASVRPFKLTRATETRNTCTYCAVACGILIYSTGDHAKNASRASCTSRATPTIRSTAARFARRAPPCSTWCTRRRGCNTRWYRAPGSNEFKRISWDDRARPHRQAHEGGSRQELRRARMPPAPR